MGKSLVIKGVDYSAVKIGSTSGEVVDNKLTQKNLTSKNMFYVSKTGTLDSVRAYFVIETEAIWNLAVSCSKNNGAIRIGIQVRKKSDFSNFMKHINNGTVSSPADSNTLDSIAVVEYDPGWIGANSNADTASVSNTNAISSDHFLVLAFSTPNNSSTYPTIDEIQNNLTLNIQGATLKERSNA